MNASRRKCKKREAIAAADDGAAPPLCQRGPALPWGHLHGTEQLLASDLRRWKAVAVVHMLERRVGEDMFRKLLRGLVKEATLQDPQGMFSHLSCFKWLSLTDFIIFLATDMLFKFELS